MMCESVICVPLGASDSNSVSWYHSLTPSQLTQTPHHSTTVHVMLKPTTTVVPVSSSVTLPASSCLRKSAVALPSRWGLLSAIHCQTAGLFQVYLHSFHLNPADPTERNIIPLVKRSRVGVIWASLDCKYLTIVSKAVILKASSGWRYRSTSM